MALVVFSLSGIKKRLSVRYVDIAGIRIALHSCNRLVMSLNSEYKAYKAAISADEQPDMEIRYVKEASEISFPSPTFEIEPLTFCAFSEGMCFYASDMGTAPKILAQANHSWTDIALRSHSTQIKPFWLDFFTEIAFRTKLSEFGGFCLHASVVSLNNKTILFSGPSGIGKSTQAELWKTRFSAEIINGDHAVIRLLEGIAHVFGSPWSGTSPYKNKANAPVSAVIVLQQAPENEIIGLKSPDTLQRLLPHCLLPYWDERASANSLATVDAFIAAVPVYLLKCRPDTEAAELLHSAIFESM